MRKNQQTNLLIITLLGVLAFTASCTVAAEKEQAKLDMYVMSQCPYGTQVVDAIAPVKETLDGALELNIHFIANDNGDGTFGSLHGQNEVLGDIVQLCAMQYNPESYLDMMTCQNQNAGAIPGNWESCAEQHGLKVNAIKTCYEGEEGKQLLSDSIEQTNLAGATASPTIFLNDEPYAGGRQTTDFMRTICNTYTQKPEACKDIPEPATVNMIVLNDERCEACDVTRLVSQLKALFPGLQVQEYDYHSEKGKAAYENLGLQALPAIIFDETVKEGEGYSNLQGYLQPVDKYYSLAIGATFDPTQEICDNNQDDTANGLVDCEDPDCTGAMECREEQENLLQVFIMSDCPYGREAVKALKDVVENFPEMEYEIHYIASETPNGFQSLHGQYEVDEDIVQLCVKEHSPEQWFDYVYCRSTNGVKGIDWNVCAEDAGVAVEAVQTCFEGEEGPELLSEDIAIANSLGVSASPTWLANNRHVFSGITPEVVKTNFCQYNDLPGCENVLDTSSEVPSGSC